MIVHIVLVRAREGLSAYEAEELAEAIKSLAQVPGVESMTSGQDFSGRSQGFTHGAVIHFADRAALDGYQVNELHRKVVETLNRLTTNKLVMDYDTGMSGIST